MSAPYIDILMYHSISDAGGPTSIAPAIFEKQMQTIAETGVPVISLDDLVAARNGTTDLAPRNVIITFDDGFVDFKTHAWPVMRDLGFKPMVYLPTAQMGQVENWTGCVPPYRPLMGWDDVRDLAGQGVHFGSHTVTHPDLNSLSPEERDVELMRSLQDMTRQLKSQPKHFAPPYGLANATVRAAVAKHYTTSVGTRLATATLASPLHDLPRIEMFYFQNMVRWKSHLLGQGGRYLTASKVKRKIGQLVLNPWQ